jgi:hypothetical protein
MSGIVRHYWDDRKAVRAVTEYRNAHRVAAARAIRKSMRWALTRMVREVAATCGISPQKLIRRRVRISVSNGTIIRGSISVMVHDIPAIKLRGVIDTGVQTGMVRTGKGVRIRGHGFYADAFVAMGRGRNWQVFRRKGKARLPIEAIKIPIRVAARESLSRWVEASVPIAQQEILRQLALRRTSGYVGVETSDVA